MNLGEGGGSAHGTGSQLFGEETGVIKSEFHNAQQVWKARVCNGFSKREWKARVRKSV